MAHGLDCCRPNGVQLIAPDLATFAANVHLVAAVSGGRRVGREWGWLGHQAGLSQRLCDRPGYDSPMSPAHCRKTVV